MCGGGTSRILRHNNVRNVIAKAIRDVGFRTDFEHGGGLGDQRRPGDIIVYNWRDGRHLLIDVAIINPLCSSNIDWLTSEGVGGAATAYCRRKERLYQDLDPSKYDFLPFIIETTGGLSKGAYGFCKEIKKRRESLNCQNELECTYTYDRNVLQSAINVELQKANGRMILERTPILDDLIDSAMVKCEIAISKKRDDAIESLRLNKLRPVRVHGEISGRQSNTTRIVRDCTRGPKNHQGINSDSKPSIKKKRKKQSPREVKTNGCTSHLKANEIPDRLPLKQKLPDEDDDWRLGKSTVGDVEGVSEERILTTKSNKSQNPSTSVTDTVLLTSRASRNERPITGAAENEATKHKNGGVSARSHLLLVDSSQIGNEVKDAEKVIWEPPDGLNLKQE